MKTVMVTGGAGFIGSSVVRLMMTEPGYRVVNLDALTYAGDLEALAAIEADERYHFVHGDIRQRKTVESVFRDYQPDAVMHLAAETHVDRSIGAPAGFIETNIVGTSVLLEVATDYWKSAGKPFRFLHVSTDEVYGSLGQSGCFTETSPYQPSSPYSASKAAADHLVRAWHRTYGLPVVLTVCTNNYGPWQFPEKLVPLMISRAIEGRTLPVYGDGLQVRDWLYVEDHARALCRVLEKGKNGETYHIGGQNEKTNIEMITTICNMLDSSVEHPRGIQSFDQLIAFVEDRPGHDLRYALDTGKIRSELGWEPGETFESGLAKTVDWYLGHMDWCRRVLEKGIMVQA